MSYGGLAHRGVRYPRELDVSAYEGLPPGWTAVEFAFKSGTQLGRTYVRFNSPIKKDALCTVKKAIEKDALNRGLGAEEAARLVKEFEDRKAAEKERKQKEREEEGFLKGGKREEAVEAFRAKYGQLDGGTVANLPGWEAKSMFRETCGQVAVTYFNEHGRGFVTIKDVEAMFGVQVLKGKELDCIAVARSRLQVDEKGRAINVARHDISMTRTAEDSVALKKRRSGLDSYEESASLAVQVLLHGNSAGEAAKGAETDELRCSAGEVQDLLVARGFGEGVQLLALQGCGSEHPLAHLLQGIFYAMPKAFNDRRCFQRVFKAVEDRALRR